MLFAKCSWRQGTEGEKESDRDREREKEREKGTNREVWKTERGKNDKWMTRNSKIEVREQCGAVFVHRKQLCT